MSSRGQSGQTLAERSRSYSSASSARTTAASSRLSAEQMHANAAAAQRAGNLPAEVRPGHGLQPVQYVEGHEITAKGAHDAASARFLQQVYGDHQLGAAISPYTAAIVREYATSLGIPAARSKAETVSRIVYAMTNGRYSANFSGAKADRAAQYEARIAKMQAQLAKLQQEYQQYQTRQRGNAR